MVAISEGHWKRGDGKVVHITRAIHLEKARWTCGDFFYQEDGTFSLAPGLTLIEKVPAPSDDTRGDR